MPETKLSIVLHRDLDSNEWFLDRVETERRNVRTQTRFTVPYPLRHAFKPPFSDFLHDVIPTQPEASAYLHETCSVPELSLNFEGLRVIAQRAIAGLQSVTIRAQKVVGRVSVIFSPQLLPDGSEAETVARLESEDAAALSSGVH